MITFPAPSMMMRRRRAPPPPPRSRARRVSAASALSAGRTSGTGRGPRPWR